jgi:dTDP-4-amino-4,6-dideoxygalactose transaminase
LQIPLLNLKKQYESLQKELEESVLKVMRSSQYILSSNVSRFEKKIAKYTGSKYAVSCANGTDALVLSLKALGISSGDEVITTSFTFFATSEAISSVGATPIFVDVDKNTYNIDPSKIEEKITKKTKAIMPVHIFGQPADMDKINNIAKKHKLFVIEDACQAIGATYKNKNIGNLADVACFSFFPTKNLGGFGDGGIITTNNENIYKIITALRNHGSGNLGLEAYNIINSSNINSKKYEGQLKYYNYLIGYNSRLDEIQAAILLVKLKQIDTWNNLRIKKAAYYNKKLKNTSLVLPKIANNVKSVFHLYILQSEKRDKLAAFLNEKGIATGIYYPIPLHLQIVYKNLGYSKGDLEVSEYLSKRTFAIPLYPELTKQEQDYIIEKIQEFEK